MANGHLVPLALILAVVAALAGTTTLSAHARLKESSPAVGEVLQTSPTQVAITFTNDVQKISGTYDIDVAGTDGRGVTAGEATLDDGDRSVMSVELQLNLPAGRYVVNWKNVSDADGDPAEGAFSFYVGIEPTAADLAADAELAAIGGDDETPLATPDETVAATAIENDVNATPNVPILETGDGEGDTNIPLIVGGAIIVVVVIGGGMWLAMRHG